MALCPCCKIEINGDNIVREKIDNGETVKTSQMTSKNMDVNTTMYSCPSCQVVLGISQYLSFSTTPKKIDLNFI